MKSKLFLGAILTVILTGGSIFAATKPKKVLTMEDAQAVALKRISGTVESSSMKKKNFVFEILSEDGIKREVTVGSNGKVKSIIVRNQT